MPRAAKSIKRWFDWPGDLDGARAEFVFLTEQDTTEIQDLARTTRAVAARDKKGIEVEVVTDNAVLRRETAIRATCAWDGFYDADGKAMECTADNKAFWSCNAGFMAFLAECQETLAKEAADEEAKARKNSKR